MTGSGPVLASKRVGYKGTRAPRPWRRAAFQSLPHAAVLALALGAGGCSFSYQLGSLFEKDEGKAQHTGSIATGSHAARAGADLPERDLAVARAAVAEAFAKAGASGSANRSTPWENPRTGARGTVTPVASAHIQDGVLCRDFLASYVYEGSESWLEGEACRDRQSRWQVRSLKPWKRT